MKISDASNIYVGSSQVSKVMLGTTKVWPNEPLPYELQYKPITEGGWGNHYINDGDTITFTGTSDFGMFTLSGDNITYNYTWSFTGDVTLKRTTTTDEGDPRGDNLPLIYTYKITGHAVLSLTEISTGITIITATFN